MGWYFFNRSTKKSGRIYDYFPRIIHFIMVVSSFSVSIGKGPWDALVNLSDSLNCNVALGILNFQPPEKVFVEYLKSIFLNIVVILFKAFSK